MIQPVDPHQRVAPSRQGRRKHRPPQPTRPGPGFEGNPAGHPLPCRGVKYITPQILRAPGGGQHKSSDPTITGSPACRRRGSCIRAVRAGCAPIVRRRWLPRQAARRA
jgi:hypothetical protein